MIKKLLNPDYAIFAVLFHIGLGFLSTQSKFAFITWFYIVLLSGILSLFNKRERLNVTLNYLIVYSVSFEILARMVKSPPFVPHELSKYLLFAFLMFGILNRYNRGRIGFFMLALILPALFYDLSGEATSANIIFNIMGAIDLALGIVYFMGQHITQKQLIDLIKLGLFPLFATLAFTIIRTPEFDNIDFALSANMTTSGGFGSNQVSTVFGLGLFFMFVLWISDKVISGYRPLDSMLILAFVFQGFLTFSRGGMLGAGIAILVVLFILTLPGSRIKGTINLSLPKITLYAIPIVILGLIVFQIANSITGNNLMLRYKGETAGTQAGMKEVDINTITSNRYNIFMGDLDLWQEHFLFGVGAGGSQFLREGDLEEDTAAHIELTRLLAEHGLPGLVFFTLLLGIPFFIWRTNQNPLNRAILLAFYTIGIYTSFHAAMRTYVTPLLVGLSTISIRELIPMQRKTTLSETKR